MGLVTLLLDVVGLALVVLGCWMLAPWLSAVVGGVGLVLLAYAIDQPRRLPAEPADR